MIVNFLKHFLDYFNQLSPYFILGLAVSGVLKTFLKDEWIQKQLKGNSITSIFKATLIGLPLPLCSCSVIPMTLTLRKMGASRASSASFLISTPETGVDSIFITLSFFSVPYAVFRVFTALLSSLLAGLLQFFFNEAPYKESEGKQSQTCCSKKNSKTTLLSGLRYSFVDLVDDIAINLIIGIFLGAIISTLFPSDPQFLTDPHMSKIIIALIAIPFYICAAASTPIAAALVDQGLSLGGALIFLSLGPATNITNLLVVRKEFGTKGILLNILAVSLVGISLGYLCDYLDFEHVKSIINKKHEHFSILNYLSSIILSILLLKSLYKKFFSTRI